MRWEILILTQPSRAEFLGRLMNLLGKQVNPVSLTCSLAPFNFLSPDGEIAVTAKLFDPAKLIGENRQAMVDESRATYVNFIDDDDLVAENYVDEISPRLDGVDFVGFKVECWKDDVLLPMAYHSLRYAGWSADELGYYRDLSYMNPIRRELAVQARIEGGYGEDRRWVDRLRAVGCVKKEHYIDKVMYHYYYRSNKEDRLAMVPR